MSLPPFSKALRTLWSESANAKTAALLASVLTYAKMQPTTGRAKLASSNSRFNRLRRREVDLEMKDGSSFHCRFQDSGALLSVYLEGDYDLPGLEWGNMNAIVDIGAHVGAFSVWAGRRATNARIVAVEPNPEVHGYLQQNLEANDLGGRNLIIHAALASKSGTGFLDNKGTSLGARIVESTHGVVRVPLVSLEQILDRAEVEEVDFLKVDCEGAEYQVLLTASKSLLSRIQVLVCEYHPGGPSDLSDLIEAMQIAGFKVDATTSDFGILTAARP